VGSISIRNLQRRVPLDVAWLRRFATLALEECLCVCDDDRFALAALEEVSVAIISDRRIAELHVDFMDISGATDVITFEHGDIAISAETARHYADEHAHSTEHELALYIVHGLLHLNGFEDREPRARRRMHAAQARVLRTCLRRLPAG
jgi:probable rRNA maturation factor